MLRYLILALLAIAPIGYAADPISDEPTIDDATAFCRFVIRKELGNPTDLVWSEPQHAVKDSRNNLTVHIAYRAAGIAKKRVTCRLRMLPNGEFQKISIR